MEDDIVAALTHEVKEEIIENYFYERRLIEEQIKYVKELAVKVTELQKNLYKRFARIYVLLQESQYVEAFIKLIGLTKTPFEKRFKRKENYQRGIRFIPVRSFTDRGRFKKLLSESYRRLVSWNAVYLDAYHEFEEECDAVNQNLKDFETNHDLLTILSYLKNIDIEGVEKKHYLGDNFSPEEVGSIEKRLQFKPVRIETFDLISPPELPRFETIQSDLGALADCIYGECSLQTKKLLQKRPK
jgi:hypothetical protein